MAPHLSAGELMAAASAHTGLHDYGDRSFVEPFEQLVAAVNAGGTLDEAGRAGFAGDMIRLLGTPPSMTVLATPLPDTAPSR